MKKELLTIALCLGMVACSENKSKPTADNEPTKKNVVEVLYFHGAQRCATCMAIEKNTKELVESTFTEQLEKGELVFQSVDISQEKTLAEKYEVSWSALVHI